MLAHCTLSIGLNKLCLHYSCVSDIPSRILFGTDGEGIRSYSELTSDVRTLISSGEDLEGLTFDWINSMLYFAKTNRIYVANEDGTDVKVASNSTQRE